MLMQKERELCGRVSVQDSLPIFPDLHSEVEIAGRPPLGRECTDVVLGLQQTRHEVRLVAG